MTLQVGHIERFNPAFEELSRRPLRPKFVTCERLGSFTGRSTDIGVVLDLMIHDLDLLLALVRSPVRDVQALGLSVLGGHEDVAQARVVFDNGCVANLSVSRVECGPAAAHAGVAARRIRLRGLREETPHAGAAVRGIAAAAARPAPPRCRGTGPAEGRAVRPAICRHWRSIARAATS